MDVRIGVTYTPREIELDLGSADADKLVAQIDEAVAAGKVLWLADKRGRKVGVPIDKLAYIELGNPFEDRRVGFGN